MTQGNAELLRELYGQRTLDAFAALLHPDAEMHQARSIPDTDDYYGREEFVEGLRLWLEEWERFRWLPEEIIDLDEDRALMRLRVSGRAKASGIELDRLAFHIWTFRDGRPWRCEVFFDEQEALEAAGLRE